MAPLLLTGLALALALQQEPNLLRDAPLHYDAPATAGLVEDVGRRLASGELELAFDERAGYLPALLKALEIPVSSQLLVFSKTSFQSERISPKTPRAVFFGDGAYVGSIPGAPIVEITSIDPERGPVFYTLDQDARQPPQFTRRDDECLQCHAGSRTQGWPANIVRSVHPDASGQPILRSGTVFVTQATPFEERWGGWYVTGTHGAARHRGNSIAKAETEMVDPEAGANVEELTEYLDTARYLSPHSDIVALMVFEHQAELHNLLTRASYVVRLALHRQEESNRFFGDPPGTLRESTQHLLASQARRLVESMLFGNEASLSAPIRGTSNFAAEFAASGRRDEHGRSLRDLDLDTRLFRYPCSYLIHSPVFETLPQELLDVVYGELWQALTGASLAGESTRLTSTDRKAILEILLATKDDLPDSWRP